MSKRADAIKTLQGYGWILHDDYPSRSIMRRQQRYGGEFVTILKNGKIADGCRVPGLPILHYVEDIRHLFEA